MEFSKYWERLKLSNPALSDESTKMTITVAQFKKSLAKAFDEGYANRREVEEAVKKLKPNRVTVFDSFDDIFKDFEKK